MRYVAKLSALARTVHGYSVNDDEAVRDAVAALGFLPEHTARLTVYHEHDDGDVTLSYFTHYGTYIIDTRL
ncbi:MAG TPA: hypothetical protein VJU59_33595 [Paraburkholderia sp.]|uniref:hypothetical protein n=1 Tax=Paraburkholderia sp. TaxID=1926495 RepID=UPI002B4869AD|nr:hypothetical protein [Paraburkholderia sp.]HKR44553.1 hypothetical protein [Paraburkholderia sp.]